MSTTHAHLASAATGKEPVRCAVVTVSDSRTSATDKSGERICEILREHRIEIVGRSLVKDEPDQIRAAIEEWVTRDDVEVVITTGGTGFSRRDTTVEVIEPLLTKKLDGFGELFRMLSYDAVGAAAMFSRAVAGLIVRESGRGDDTYIFALPGSVNAVETAMAKLIAPQLSHLVWLRRD